MRDAAKPPERLRALLAEAHRRGRDVLVLTLVCAEVAVSRHDRTRGDRPAVRLVDADFALARQIDTILDAVRAAASVSPVRASRVRG